MLAELKQIKKVTVQKFDLQSVPFSQGYAIKSIVGMIGGSLLAAGQVISGYDGEYTLLYVESIKGDRAAQSLWVDDGVSVVCKYVNLGDCWQMKTEDGWVKVEGMFVEFA